MPRNGSRAMMNADESGVIESPSPAPISCASDLAIPKLATLGFWVRSVIWADAGEYCQKVAAQRMRRTRAKDIFSLACFIHELLLRIVGHGSGQCLHKCFINKRR